MLVALRQHYKLYMIIAQCQRSLINLLLQMWEHGTIVGCVQCIIVAGFEVIHGLLDRVMQLLEVSFTKDGSGYFLKAAESEGCISTAVYVC